MHVRWNLEEDKLGPTYSKKLPNKKKKKRKKKIYSQLVKLKFGWYLPIYGLCWSLVYTIVLMALIHLTMAHTAT